MPTSTVRDHLTKLMGDIQGSPTAPLSQLLDPREGAQSTTDAAGNTTIFHRDGSFNLRGADGQVFVSHGDTFFRRDSEGIWAVTRISGEQRVSERDRTWINFNSAVDGSWWDYVLEKQIWHEWGSLHPTRPQGSCVGIDRNTRVTEILGNVFAESDKGYFVHWRGHPLAEGRLIPDAWLPQSPEQFALNQVGRRGLEDVHRSPVLWERLGATNVSLYALGRAMRFVACALDEVSGFVPFAGKVKGTIEAIRAFHEMSHTPERIFDQQKDVASFVAGTTVDGSKVANERGTAVSALNASSATDRAKIIEDGLQTERFLEKWAREGTEAVLENHKQWQLAGGAIFIGSICCAVFGLLMGGLGDRWFLHRARNFVPDETRRRVV